MLDRTSFAGLLRSGSPPLRFAVLLALPIPLLAFPPRAAAQADVGFRLPVELFQGAALDAGPTTPYQAGVAVIPAWSFPSVRVGLKLSMDYDNPSWRGRGGVRLSSRVVDVVRADIGLILGGEATSTVKGDVRLGAGLTFDVDGLIRVGAWGGWEEIHDGGWFGVTFGADPTSWFQCVPDDFGEGCGP